MITDFHNIAIYYNTKHSNSKNMVSKLASIMSKCQVNTFIEAINPAACVFFKEPDFKPDLIIIIGGDGTFLCAARTFASKGIPIFGINSGNLGFLSQTSIDTFEESLNRLLSGDYRIEERLMLEAVDTKYNTSTTLTALNDIVIKRGTVSRPLVLNVFVGDDKVNDFLGDGLIVSTPTGSTAYNLSAGGPIIQPGMKAIVLCPIASHSLAMRPIVIPDTQVVTITIMNEPGEVFISGDGQDHTPLQQGSTVNVAKKPYKARLVLLGKDEDGFFKVLREKLHWGIFPGKCPDHNVKQNLKVL
jgi:NAD+ kinase